MPSQNGGERLSNLHMTHLGVLPPNWNTNYRNAGSKHTCIKSYWLVENSGMKAMKILLLMAIAFSGAFTVFAQTWTTNAAPNLSWTSVASSADGSRLAAVAFTGPVYTSTNSGLTWNTNASPISGWKSIVLSADGTILAACLQSGLGYISTNAGATWQYFGHSGSFIALSADGFHLAVALSGSSIYVSTNFGASWQTTTAPAKSWSCIASSANGQKLVAAVANEAIYTSSDFGNSWTSNSVPTKQWSAAAMSADGNFAVVVAGMKNGSSGPIFLSTNSSASWFQANAPVTNWVSVAVSADGRKLFALVAGNSPDGPNPFYTSTNYGLDWTTTSGPNAWWSSIASSADGGKLIAAASLVYTTQTTMTPVLALDATSGLQVSWIIPSTNFVLQQNSDLTSTNWLVVPNVPALNLTNLQNQVMLPLPAGNNFYRLKAP